MNWSIRIASVLLFVSFIISCKKDNDPDANKTRLSKLVSWDLSDPSKNIDVTEFKYDDQKRVTEIASFKGDSVNGEIKRTREGRNIKFFYNGNNKNPYKSIGGLDNITIAGQEIYHFYNGDRALIRDSFPGTPPYSGSNRNYFYSSGKIIVQKEMPGNLTDKILKDSFIVSDHNLIEGYYFISPLSPATNGQKIVYDNKANPISKLNIANVTTVNGPNGFPTYLAPGFCKNNITEITDGSSTEPGQFTSINTSTYSYSYQNNGLPKECSFYRLPFYYLIKYYYID